MCRSFEQAAASSLPTPAGTTGTDLAVRVGGLLGNAWSVAGASGIAATSAAGAAASLAVSIGAPIFGALAAMYTVGRVAERAEALGKYNAFLTAFAQSVSDFSRGIDRRRRNFAWQDASIRGRNAAIYILNEIGQERRRQVFAVYRKRSDQMAVHAIVASMGGFLTR